MSNTVVEQLSRYRDLQAQYEAFCTEQHLVTAQVIGCATTARLEAIDLERCRWEDVHRDEIKAFGSLDTFTPPAWPSVPPSPDSWPVAAVGRWSSVGARTLC
jgi:hypothetical protein